MQTETYDVRLVVHFEDGGYKARWIEPDGQETKTFPLDLPLDDGDKSDLRWYLEQYANFVGAGDRVRAAELEERINGWGRSLFDALFNSAEGARVHTRLMDAARDGRPAILTLGTNESDVHVQPWEMLRDGRGPLVFQGVTIRRQLQGAAAARRHALTLPLSVLMIISRPRDAGFIDPRNSIAPMLDALDALPGQVTVDFCEPPAGNACGRVRGGFRRGALCSVGCRPLASRRHAPCRRFYPGRLLVESPDATRPPDRLLPAGLRPESPLIARGLPGPLGSRWLACLIPEVP